MTEVRARIAEVLQPLVDDDHWADHMADVLLALPDIRVVVLPSESWPCLHGRSFGTDVHTYKDRVLVGHDLDISPDYARALAAALLAAADAAEQAAK